MPRVLLREVRRPGSPVRRFLRRLLGRRWSVVIVGEVSGNRTPLDFVNFRKRSAAEAWVERMNSRDARFATKFEVVDRG